MSAVALGVAAALVALRCQLITDDPYVLGAVSQVLPATRPAFLRALNATRRLIGCPVEGDVEEPPAGGITGQCPVCYEINLIGTAIGTVRNRIGAVGPIGGVRYVESEGGGFVEIFASSVTSGVNPFTQQLSGCNPVDEPAWRSADTGGTAWADVRIESLRRLDNLPDDCGDGAPEYPPPTNIETNIDITYNIDEGTEVTVTVPFVFAPITANFDGTLRIPVTFDLGGFEFSGDINLPDFDFTLNPPKLPPGSKDFIDEQPEDRPGESVPALPENEKIIGVVVNVLDTESDRVSSYSSPGIPNIFAPRLGSVKFAYSLGAATFWSSDIDIKGDRTFIECPFSQGADAVVASPQTGVALSFVPIRGFPLATTADLARAIAANTAAAAP